MTESSALERVFTENADVALLDDSMPRMSGLRAAEVLRTCVPRAEPFLFTAASESFADEAAAIGVRVISKLDSQNLVRQILEAGEAARARPVEPVKSAWQRVCLAGFERPR